MSKGSKITTTDMQMRVLQGFDYELRMGGHFTSGLLRNETIGNWKTPPVSTPAKRLTGTDGRIARIKAEIAEADRMAAYRTYGN
jgi:hypothetical protein